MIQIRPANERGHSRLDWLDSHHSFSFGEYRDPRHMGVSNLRVINEDIVAPGGGFATHGDEAGLHSRRPRLPFERAVEVL